MWLPLLLQNLNEEEMRDMGMQISAEDIYSINSGSLKDAIVHFGGFCTGEVISDRGLVLTNHHCGFSAIQQHSTLEDNLLGDGFWAADHAAEKPNPGLFVTFIERIEDVSDRVLRDVTAELSEEERAKTIATNLEALRSSYGLEAQQELVVKPFYDGNEYYAFVTKKYPDVRLVGAPPSSIGKYGADTDNWEWPRHTGDFSLFRIYTAPDGSPAEYAAENVPMQPKRHLEISLKGIRPGDFSMIFGFPGRTDQYLPAAAMRQRTEIVNPIRIRMRDLSLGVIDSAMRADPQLRIDYASKQARIANAWKKWRGESEGVAAFDGLEKREAMEASFAERLVDKQNSRAAFGALLPKMNELVGRQESYAISRAYVGELNYNVDLFRVASMLRGQLKVAENNGTEAFAERVPRIIDYLRNFYRGYNPSVDRRVAKPLIKAYFEQLPPEHQSQFVRDQYTFSADLSSLVDDLFQGSYLRRGDRLIELLEGNPEAAIDAIRGDRAYQFVYHLNKHNEQRVLDPYNEIAERMNPLQRKYMAALRQVFPDRRFYPDANSTMRVSYGKFEGFTGMDGSDNHYMTYLDGVIAKYVPGDYEFDLPAELLQLHERKDYGRYATEDGKLPVCVLGSNHTTGGNSGSPALDAEGRLVGLNFDRTWQSTMSDVNYDPAICRNIMVDIRYVLFLVDKLGQAPHLVAEMSLVD